MTRQTDRSEARHAAKVERANARGPARAAIRKEKHLSPADKTQLAGYPKSRYVGYFETGESYPFSNTRQNARYARQAEGRSNG